MALLIREVGGLNVILLADGFPVEVQGWYAPLLAVATVVGTSKENLRGLLDRRPGLHANNAVLRLTHSSVVASRWQQLVCAYDTVRAVCDRQRKRKPKKKRKRPVQNLTLYPLALAVQVMNYYVGKGTCTADQLAAVQALAAGDNTAGDNDDDDDEDDDSAVDMGEVGCHARSPIDVADEMEESKFTVKREPVSYLEFPTVMEGARILIDLTGPVASEADDVISLTRWPARWRTTSSRPPRRRGRTPH